MQWTVDDLDSGGGLMANKNKCLASESDGDVFVPYLRWVAHGGSGESSIGSKTKLFERVFSQEFRNLKLFLKIPGFRFFKIHRSPREFKTFFKNSRFSIFLKSIVPAGKCSAILLPPILFLKMTSSLRTHRFLSC